MLVCAIRTVIIYVLIIIAIRVMGKRQIGELRPSELVVALLIADLAAVPMQETGTPLLHGIIPMLVLVALELLSSVIMMKCPRFERLVSGNPVPIVRDGTLDVGALKKLRLSVDDLMQALREQNCFDLSEVEYAVAEPSGKITLFFKPPYRPVTCEDLQTTPADGGMPALIIADGNFCPWGLDICSKSEQMVGAFLTRQGLMQSEVFVMTLSAGGDFFILTNTGKQLKGAETF